MFPKIGRTKLIDFLLGVTGPGATFRLTKTDWAGLDQDVTLADLTEADFVGYAPLAGVAFPAAIVNGLGHGETLSPVLTWTAGALAGPQTIYAAYMTITVSGSVELIFYRRFGVPESVFNPGDVIQKKMNILDDDSNVPPF